MSAGGPRGAAGPLSHDDADGAFVRLRAGHDAAYLCELDVWLHVRTRDDIAWLEITRDAAGRDPVPTVEQALQLEQQARKREEEALQLEQQARKREEEARKDAEAKLAAALAEIEKLRSGA